MVSTSCTIVHVSSLGISTGAFQSYFFQKLEWERLVKIKEKQHHNTLLFEPDFRKVNKMR